MVGTTHLQFSIVLAQGGLVLPPPTQIPTFPEFSVSTTPLSLACFLGWEIQLLSVPCPGPTASGQHGFHTLSFLHTASATRPHPITPTLVPLSPTHTPWSPLPEKKPFSHFLCQNRLFRLTYHTSPSLSPQLICFEPLACVKIPPIPINLGQDRLLNQSLMPQRRGNPAFPLLH